MKPDYFDKTNYPPVFDEFNEFFRQTERFIRSNANAKEIKGNKRNGALDRRQAFKKICK